MKKSSPEYKCVCDTEPQKPLPGRLDTDIAIRPAGGLILLFIILFFTYLFRFTHVSFFASLFLYCMRPPVSHQFPTVLP